MGYVNSIGGDPINPNPFTYSAISMTGNISLGWPISGQSPTYSATDWIDITSSAAYAVAMPDATQVGIGTEVVFNNYGSYTITINDNAGGGITTILAGQTKRVYVITNATAAGTWRVVNIGVGTSNADASALAGYGLVASAGVLSQQYPTTSYNSNQTVNSGYRASLAIWTGGSGTFTLTAPATLGANWFFNVRNSGSGTLTLNAGAALINGSTTLDASVGEGFTVVTDGSNFYTLGKIAPNSSGLTLLNKSVAGSADVTLTAGEAAYNIINFTGVLTGNINVIVPTSVRSWYFYNNTTGSYTVTVKTSAGTGLAIAQTTRSIMYCDGTNVVSPVTTATGTVTSITAGTGLSGGTITSSGTIALANTAVGAGSYGSIDQISTFTADAQGRLTAAANAAVAESTIASATTTDLSTATSPNVIISGTTTITGFGTVAAGIKRFVRFTGALTLTHNGTSLILPTSANIQTVSGDSLVAISLGSGNWKVLSYTPVSGLPVAFGSSQVSGFRNAIVNGAFNVWQQNTSYALTTSVAYGSADMFAFNMPTSAAGIANQSTSVPSGFQYALKLGRTAASALTNAITLYQALTTANSIGLQGQVVTLSFYAKAGANFSPTSNNISVKVYTGTGTDQSTVNMAAGSWTGSATPISSTQAITTSYVRYQFSAALSGSATQVGIQIGYTPTGTAGADDNLYITGIQLEAAPAATPFEFRPWDVELRMCRFHYGQSYDYGVFPGAVTTTGAEAGFSFNATLFYGNQLTKYGSGPMRTTPTIVTYSTTGASGKIRETSTNTDLTPTVADIGVNGYVLSPTGSGNSNSCRWHATYSARL